MGIVLPKQCVTILVFFCSASAQVETNVAIAFPVVAMRKQRSQKRNFAISYEHTVNVGN